MGAQRLIDVAVGQIRLFKVLLSCVLLPDSQEQAKTYNKLLKDCAAEIALSAERLIPQVEANELKDALNTALGELTRSNYEAMSHALKVFEARIAPSRFVIPPGNDERLLGERFLNDHRSILMLADEQNVGIREFCEEISKGVFEMESAPCVCGGIEFTDIANKDRYGLPVTTTVCKRCGLVMTRPRMTQAGYDDFYDRYYRKIYGGSAESNSDGFDGRRAHGEAIYSACREYLPHRANVLEIGCADGGILWPFMEAGHEVTGIDLGGDFLRYGREKGLNLMRIHSEELLKEREGSFDFIILSHVAEHFLDLRKEFGIIRRLLRDRGTVYIEVPGLKNIKGYNFDYLLYFQNAHVYHFSSETLIQTLSLYGFSPIVHNEWVMSLFEKSAPGNENSVYSYYKDTMDYMFAAEDYFYSK